MTMDESGSRSGQVARAQLNRLIAAVVVPLALVHVALSERVRPGRGGRVARRWIAVAARLTGLRFEVAGTGTAGDGQSRILVANHSSLLDIPALIVACPEARFVAGADLFRIPLLAAAMRSLDTVPVDRRGKERTVLRVPDVGDAGSTLVIFAEGKIAPPGERLPFRGGAFALAIEHGVPIVPVAIHHSSARLPPRARLAVRPGTVGVRFLEPWPTTGLGMEERHRLRDQVEGALLGALTAADGGSLVPGRP
ncbi:MAG TPA: lysophospholipid acyltransferase family protein [Acidimicrobiales bacterium]|nr:lysophospholipid acyltransferase family protein [Acidimicrobiales bacterium]